MRTAKGLNKLLAKVIDGQSLSGAIADLTAYTSTADFVSKFSNDAGGFVQTLLDKAGSEGRGSLIKGDFSKEDLVPDGEPTVKINLFTVDKDHTEVANTYPVTDHNPIEGGNTTAGGIEPESSYNPGAIDAPAPIDPTTLPTDTYPADLFTVTDKDGNSLAAGTDYEFDTATGVLTILKPTAGGYKISGGSKTDGLGRVLIGRIVIDASAVAAAETDRTFDITLDGVTIDQSAKAGACAVAIKGSDSDDTA